MKTRATLILGTFFCVILSIACEQSVHSIKQIELVSIEKNSSVSKSYKWNTPIVKDKKKHKKTRKWKKAKRGQQHQDGIRLGFLLMIVGGIGLSALAIYIGTLIIPWSAGLSIGCLSSSGILVLITASFAWVGFVALCCIALALLIWGLILAFWVKPR